MRWPCHNGGAAHFTTIIPINYRSDGTPCFNNTGNTDFRPEITEHARKNWAVSWGF